jgi:hypothetical protein
VPLAIPPPFKWVAYQNSTTVGFINSVAIGSFNVGQALGPFATGDLYIIVLGVSSNTDPGLISLSGTGWTQLIQINLTGAQGLRLAAFAKAAVPGETGIYTASWPNGGVPSWVSYNYGNATFDVANGQAALNTTAVTAIAPSCSPTGPADILLANYLSADGVVPIILPGSLASVVNQQCAGNVMASGQLSLTSSGPTAALTATLDRSTLAWAAFQLALKPPPPIVSLFPGFTPLIPPPLIGQGGGPPPTFPPISPATAPVPIPPGVLVGPAIAAAAVPPSTAGFPLIRYGGTGSATVPTIASLFPAFTTTFPSPTFVVSNVWTVPTFAGGVWTSTLPARTATTPCVPTGGWGLPGPSGSGPGPPSYPTPPGTGLPHHDLSALATVAENDNASSEGASATAEIPRRRRRASA